MFARFSKRFIGRTAVTVLAIGALSTAVAPAASAAAYGTSRAGAGIYSVGNCGIIPPSYSTIGGTRDYSISIFSAGFEYISTGIYQDGQTSWIATQSVSQSYATYIPISALRTSPRTFVIVGWDWINGQYEQTWINTYFNHAPGSSNPWTC